MPPPASYWSLMELQQKQIIFTLSCILSLTANCSSGPSFTASFSDPAYIHLCTCTGHGGQTGGCARCCKFMVLVVLDHKSVLCQNKTLLLLRWFGLSLKSKQDENHMLL